MSKYFNEDYRQVHPCSMTAFGMKISSRYGDADEIIQLLQFAQMAAARDIAHYVKAVFYDSKSSLCFFELEPLVQRDDGIASALLEIATAVFVQFDWFGSIHHGGVAVAEAMRPDQRDGYISDN